MENKLTPAEVEAGLTQEKKDDPFGVEHPPVPTSNADDKAVKYSKTVYHAQLPDLTVHNDLEYSNAKVHGYTDVNLPKVKTFGSSHFTMYPVSFYKLNEQPRVVYNAIDAAQAIQDGFSLNYVHQEFPKHVGRFTVNNEVEEVRAIAATFAEDSAKAAGEPRPPVPDGLTVSDPTQKPEAPKA